MRVHRLRALRRAGPARRVIVVLSGLLEKSFPGECWARRLAGQARNLQRQRQPEAALARCQQALTRLLVIIHYCCCEQGCIYP